VVGDEGGDGQLQFLDAAMNAAADLALGQKRRHRPRLRSRRRRLQGYSRDRSSNPQWIQEPMIAWVLP
jgi:hypothetical protein